MGAEGNIIIWRDDIVRRKWPDCDELFRHIPTHYLDELDGIKYHHCYWGDNLYVDWGYEKDWYVDYYKDGKGIIKHNIKNRLIEFVEWLEANGTTWEVWT